MNAQQEKTVLGDMSNRCPYCKEQIQQGALKCRYCQSSLLKADGPSSAEKMADLVIKTVGIVPAVMTLLLLLAGLYGFKAVSDVEKMAKEVETTSEKIQKVAKDG